jgi:dTDP-4-dehydrorhamnose 3,5-epimerase
MNGYLITGASGQLGKALQAIYPEARHTSHEELDITNQSAVQNFDWGGINTVINAAGYTDVDGAETEQGRQEARRVNEQGAANLADIASKKDLVLVHISTDYVFDGTKNPHTEDEPLSPLSAYGASKAAGDRAVAKTKKHYILRTSWLIGDGKNFVNTMLELAKKGVNPSVVSDQVGRPTFTTELARAIDHLLKVQAPFGVYNVSNEGEPVSWADFARAIFKEANLNNTVTDTTTAEYYKNKPGGATRPLNSVFDLSKIKATGFTPRNWHDDLAQYIKKEAR